VLGKKKYIIAAGGGGFTSCLIGVSGNLGIILSLAFKSDGSVHVGSTAVIFVLLLFIVSFNIFEVMKDDILSA